MLVNRKYLYLCIFDFIYLIISILIGVNITFSLTILVWINIVVYSTFDLKRRSLLFAFSIAFFTVLLSREFLEIYFHYQPEYFPDYVQEHTYRVLLISLISLFLTYLATSYFSHDRVVNKGIYKSKSSFTLQRVSYYLYFIAFGFSIVYIIMKSVFVFKTGYAESYTSDFYRLLGGGIIVFILDKIDQMLIVFLSFFLATMPTKKQTKLPIFTYLIYLILNLFTGQRSMIVLGLLWIFIYFNYRNRDGNSEKWITRRQIYLVLAVVPFFLLLLSVVSAFREGESFSFSGILNELGNFFYQQGVSINVIKREYQYSSLLPNNKFYSLEFITVGLIGKLLGFQTYIGNNIEHAVNGYSLAHALSFITMRSLYLTGRGIGTSYIAELYHDFGLLGVVIGNIFYGILLYKLSNLRSSSVFVTAIKLLVIQQILWAPRGGFSDFISLLFRPSIVIGIILIYLVAGILLNNSKYSYRRGVSNV